MEGTIHEMIDRIDDVEVELAVDRHVMKGQISPNCWRDGSLGFSSDAQIPAIGMKL
jgi:hypothetical protein